jgi:hypothetical protein
MTIDDSPRWLAIDVEKDRARVHDGAATECLGMRYTHKMTKLMALAIYCGLAGALGLHASHARAVAELGPQSSSTSHIDRAQFTPDGKLVRPTGYRRWVYLSSGFGMSYNPDAGGNGNPAFTNVFISAKAYDYFRHHGTWPDKAIFVLEIYGSTSRGSINEKGSYQESLVGLDVEVKDESRFPYTWAYFNFDGDAKTAGPVAPSKNACWNCHDKNAAVEHSFVQFYPELLQIAREKSTIKPSVALGEKK